MVGERKIRDGVPEREAVPFGVRLRGLREQAGLTQEELAFRAGLSPNAVGALERGARRRPQPHTVRSLSDALGLPEEERAALLASIPKRGEASSSAKQKLSPASPASLPTLPHPATALVGREREIEEVSGLLTQREDVRLVTLTGIGGVGKTRLAVEVAREASGHFPDGAMFVGLAPLSDPSLVVPTILRSLGMPEPEGRTPGEALIDHLRDRNFLLVLDNLEHLLGAAPEVAALIEACPHLVVLATSRAPLRIRGERDYPVPPLVLPASTRSPNEEEVLASPSGTLFVERARAASASFTLARENAPSVAQICWRLAGLPLALELAAAKVRFLDPATLLSRLDRALSTSWARDLPERQRTMRATLDWSHELLAAPERQLFRRLSVFSGGFSLEAAEGVDTSVDGHEQEVLDRLEVLVEQSLVIVEPGAGGYEARYGMLEPIRQYAREKLEESGEAEEVRRRHAEYYLALAEAADQKLRSPEQVSWLNRLETEHGNLRAAMGWLLDRRDTETAARLGWALWLFWYLRGHSGEGLSWMEEMLSFGEGALSARARARASCVAGMMTFRLGREQPLTRLEAALDLFRSVSDTTGVAMATHFLGLTTLRAGDAERAEGYLGEGLRLCRSLGDAWSEAIVLGTLGLLPFVRGDYEEAELHYERALSLGRPLGDPLVMLPSLYQLAYLAQIRSDHGLAAGRYREALALGVELGDIEDVGKCLQGLAECAVAGGNHVRAGRLYGASEAAFESTGFAFRPFHTSPSFHERYLALAQDELGNRAWSEALEEGRRMPLEEVVGYALEGGSSIT